MKILKTILIASISPLCISANVSIEATSIEALRVSEETKIAYVNPKNTIESVNNSCSAKDLYALDTNDFNYQSMMSILLAAGASGKTVTLWVSDVANDCLNDRQRVKVVQINF